MEDQRIEHDHLVEQLRQLLHLVGCPDVEIPERLPDEFIATVYVAVLLRRCSYAARPLGSSSGPFMCRPVRSADSWELVEHDLVLDHQAQPELSDRVNLLLHYTSTVNCCLLNK